MLLFANLFSEALLSLLRHIVLLLISLTRAFAYGCLLNIVQETEQKRCFILIVVYHLTVY